jgi:hypothetical protein
MILARRLDSLYEIGHIAPQLILNSLFSYDNPVMTLIGAAAEEILGRHLTTPARKPRRAGALFG